MAASRGGHTDTLALLLANKADGGSTLKFAARSGHFDAAELLLSAKVFKLQIVR
jgi:hypothetical protein